MVLLCGPGHPFIGVALDIGSDERIAGELLDALVSTAELHGFALSPVPGSIGPRSSLTTLQGIGIVLTQQRSDLVFSRDAGDPGRAP